MIKGLHELTLSSFTGFVWKKPCKKKKARINYFDEQYKPRIYYIDGCLAASDLFHVFYTIN